ncbi:MAG: ATP-dependent RecD-like DNA helicase [Firmicutes bacterium]|nr:ATP-dependent RecD-like DNA helicase [Bacillota bacterium]
MDRGAERGTDPIELAGTVKAVVYQNAESGYTVLRLETQDGETVNAVGCLPYAAVGEKLLLTGVWTRHAQHGEQFKAETAQRDFPRDADAIYAYLASRAVSGIGPATALLIVTAFGDRALDVLENEPERLSQVRGISAKKAREMSENFKKQTALRRLMEFLYAEGISPQLAMRIYRFYGDSSLNILHSNPYILAQDHIGGAFSEADQLALNLGFESDCTERIEAALGFELRHNAGNGHCFIPGDKLIAATAQLIGAERETVEEALDALSEDGDIVCETIAGVRGCYLRRLYEAETACAGRLKALAAEDGDISKNADKLIDSLESELGIRYAAIQRETIRLAAKKSLLVITGGPGTGKTTCIRAIAALFERAGLEIALTAPTGRAAKRMAELTGREAQTIHRLLEAGYSPETDETVFQRDAEEPLKCGAVILDECSMVDITLMAALLDAMPEHCRLVMVGDADQLPSVGPGNVFADIIRSGVAETVRLTEIFRQTAASRIVTSAHSINRGEYPDLKENGEGFFFMRRTDINRAVDTIVELVSKRLPENMGIPASDIQVLTPTRRYETGTYNLNLRLQAALKPSAVGKKEWKFGDFTFREGDRVMQIRNNYDIMWKKGGGPTDKGSPQPEESGQGVFNGDIGKIVSIDDLEDIIYVDFDDRVAAYSADMLSELEHAWAMTVHKSQGSEFRAVVLSVSKGAGVLLTRSVLYTAVTRAKELLVAVGDERVFGAMIDNYRQVRRYSGLRARLADG